MNIDFHYYGTYLAAREAGFTKEEAGVIAYAAQLVDDCTIHTFSKKVEFEQIETSRDLNDIIADALNITEAYTEEDVRKAKEIWSYFHFLPGNQNDRVGYHGKTKSSIFELASWTFSPDKFRMMCLPESNLCQEMIADTMAANHESPWFLHLIGIRMHVLADTWAHVNFAGIPEWSINDVRQSQGIDEYDSGRWYRAEADALKPDSPSNHTYHIANATSARYVSPVYLGHGQIGQMPDLGYIRFRYVPVWREKLDEGQRKIERDNQQNFLKAFAQMVCALKSIHDGDAYPQYADENLIGSDLRNEIKNVLSVRKLDQSDEWKTLIHHRLDEMPAEYRPQLWKEVCENSADKNATDYSYFCRGAKYHKEFLKAKF